MSTRRDFCKSALLCVLGSSTVRGQDSPSAGNFNMVLPTWGGKQLWADVVCFCGWRIQRNSLTGHHRLLDPRDLRYAWGSLEACQAKLLELREEHQLPPLQGEAIVVLHGLFRTRASMRSICRHFSSSGCENVVDVGYPTTRADVTEHAQTLDSVMCNLEGVTNVNFVAHSLGNLVIRRWFKLKEGESLPFRLGRMVMLTPPNHHPEMAARFLSHKLAQQVVGAAAAELAEGWDGLEAQLAIPPIEFGILAGGKGDDKGYNPLLAGDDDGIVTVESTWLPGARDYRCLPVLHSFFMDNARVQQLAHHFLEHGVFESEETRVPLSADGPVG